MSIGTKNSLIFPANSPSKYRVLFMLFKGDSDLTIPESDVAEALLLMESMESTLSYIVHFVIVNFKSLLLALGYCNCG